MNNNKKTEREFTKIEIIYGEEMTEEQRKQNEIVTRWRKEKGQLERKGYDYGRSMAQEVAEDMPFQEASDFVDNAQNEHWRPEDYREWDWFREEIEEQGYDEACCFRGLADGIKEIFEKI